MSLMKLKKIESLILKKISNMYGMIISIDFLSVANNIY